MNENQLPKLRRTARWMENKLKGRRPSVALIMGSGLSDSVPELKNPVVMKYSEIPGFLRSSVSGHKGQLVVGDYGGRTIAVMQGRFHYYEGYKISDLALAVRALWLIGVKDLVVTAAVGSVRRQMKPGDVVVLEDHINFMCRNPLRGNYDPAFGPMFPDMTNDYDRELRRLALSVCKKLKMRAHTGVYLGGTGPSYETAAEIRAFAMWGADVVGMSTVPEVIAARQLRMRVLGLSWVTNFATGISKSALSHQEVLEQGRKVALRLKDFLAEFLKSRELAA